MKKLLTTLLLLVGVSAFGQGTAIRSQNGFGTNTSFYGTVTNATINQMRSSVLGSLWTLLDTNGLNRIAVIDTMLTLRDTNNIRFRIDGNGGVTIYASNGNVMASFNTNVANFLSTVASTNFVGDGGGLTNLGNAGTTIIVNGKATFTSNVFFTTVSYSTNSADSETTIDLSKNYRAFATNNNTAFSALAGIEAAQTNIQSVNIFITNSSASAKTITMAASFQNMNAIEGNTLSVTNVGHLLVFYYPGFGTNFYFKSR